MNQIAYKKRRIWKYRLEKAYKIALPFTLLKNITLGPISFSMTGVLKIRSGYTWDGPSGPAIDTRSFMRGSLVHDALYQLMREGLLDIGHRQMADTILKDICIEDGMWKFRAAWVYRGVRKFGVKSAKPDMLYAP